MPRQQASLTVEAHKALVGAAAYASGLRNERVTMSDALVAMAVLARSHPDEFARVLTTGEPAS